MEHYKDLLHIQFAERVMGWTRIEPSRESGALKFYGFVQTGKGPQRREIPDYSNDLDAIWAAEQYLNRLGMARAYINALAEVTGVTDFSDERDLFKLISASPAQRCEAGLKAYEAGEAEAAGADSR
ncbi:MAG TPA: hypothetical protein VF527_08925 [Pyrinomonadaceae bacterium]|jgi:hypothetical protein